MLTFNLLTVFCLFQLQDAGRWIDAATLAATHLQGSDHARFVYVTVCRYLQIGTFWLHHSNAIVSDFPTLITLRLLQGLGEVGSSCIE